MDTAGNEKALLARLRDGEHDSPLLRRVLRNNQIRLHNYRAEIAQTCACPLEGCDRSFAITLIPNQILYPRFCEAHRSEFRREFHLAQIGAGKTDPLAETVSLESAALE